MIRPIKTILIANRGEIACRVIRTSREMGIKSVAVFSDSDRLAQHVKMADEAVYIGKSESSQSYLNIEVIIDAAKKARADAIHPGYGFLSENQVFAQKVISAGLIFIGPDPSTISLLGDKLESKKIASQSGIPVVPGLDIPVMDMEGARKSAQNIGYPVMIKAAAGGGGKGIRIVLSEEDLEMQLDRAKSEALSAFGSNKVYIEKLIEDPRHIEIQVLGDHYGNILSLFERECSIQRRHQKIIEEAPSSFLNEGLRSSMGKAAVKIAQKCNYKNAGTVEFMVDRHKNFYFLEMNTRLQVEHPVTELITGIDLVREQIRIASGETLGRQQSDISFRGHALELRIYAEDPDNEFMPDPGKIITYDVPKGPGVRIDDGYSKDMEIPVYYDSLISKLITWGENREQAIQRMRRALDEYDISGISTTIPFGKKVFKLNEFIAGNVDTGFIRKMAPTLQDTEENDDEKIAALLAGWLKGSDHKKPIKNDLIINTSSWRNRKY